MDDLKLLLWPSIVILFQLTSWKSNVLGLTMVIISCGMFGQIRDAGPKMVPFLKAVSIYFILETYKHHGHYWSTLLKCAPIISLIIFIFLYGINSTQNVTYTHKIILGLTFSSIGDALLSHDFFPHGMSAFAIAQIFYISAFGFKPLRIWIGLPLYAGGAATVLYLRNHLEPVILVGLPIYTVLLLTMCWRSIALVSVEKKNKNILNTICGISSVLFVISDSLIGFDKYYKPFDNSTLWIMITYYAAQFGITLSIVDLKRTKLRDNNKPNGKQSNLLHKNE